VNPKRQPLYPHIPSSKREPLYPHVKLVKELAVATPPVTEPKYQITAEDLVYSRSREEIQAKLQQIFGSYESLEKMEETGIPTTIEAAALSRLEEKGSFLMADLEYAAVARDLEETKHLLEVAHAEFKLVSDAVKKGKTLLQISHLTLSELSRL